MARPRVDLFWREHVRTLAANDPRLGARAVATKLECIGQGLKPPRNDYPSERAVGRLLREFRQLPEQEKITYQEFYWPEAMIRGDLPWEASPYALELLRHTTTEASFRPLIRGTRWFYRVSLAAGDAPLEERVAGAKLLATLEVLGRVPEGSRGLERYLAFTPWRSAQDSEAYKKMVAAGEVSPFKVKAGARSLGGLSSETYADALVNSELGLYSAETITAVLERLAEARLAEADGEKGENTDD